MIELVLEGRVTPKARPRFTGKTTYLPEGYRQWKDGAIAQITDQLPAHWQPLERVTATIHLHGSHRGDLDNLAGAILDALVQAGVVVDDRLSCLPSLSIDHVPGDRAGATILLTQPPAIA